MVSEKVQIQKDIFFVGRKSGKGRGGSEKKGYMKALRLELVMVDYLDRTGALVMKLDQVSGCGEMCGILS